MNNWITDLEINNFKSIRKIKMDCKRINVLIGKPNVGKSNILEALCLYLAPYCDINKKLFEDYIRYEKLNNLFYDLDRKNQIRVKTNLGFAVLRYHFNNINAYDILISNDEKMLVAMNNFKQEDNSLFLIKQHFDEISNAQEFDNIELQLNPPISSFYASLNDNQSTNAYGQITNVYTSPIKKYHFRTLSEHKNHFPSFLRPPYGDNLFTILEGNPKIWDECAGFFNEYGLDLLLDTEDEKIEVQKKIGRRVTKIPYSLAADTLQRFIFHLAAIESNTNSILLFEEPESHSFPKYISDLAIKIIESKDNQFFIATHSPYLLTPFIEECPREEIAIFIANYENYETKIRVLTGEEMDNIMETGIDLFFNIRAFQE